MFKSIKFLQYSFKNNTYEYELIDSDFTAQMAATTPAARVPAAASVAVAIIKEYEKRNLDVVRNLFLYLKFIKETYGYEINPEINYLTYIDKYYPEIKFKEKYCDKLVDYTKKMITLV